MAEDSKTQEVVVPEAEKPVTATAEKDVVVTPEPEKLEVVEEAEKPKEGEKITQQVSFKEETNVVGELPESQKKALEDLRKLIQEACAKREFSAPPPPPTPVAVKEEEKKDVVKAGEQTAPPTDVVVVEGETAAPVVAEELAPAPADTIASESTDAEAKVEPTEDLSLPAPKTEAVVAGAEKPLKAEEPKEEAPADTVASVSTVDTEATVAVASEEPPKVEEQSDEVAKTEEEEEEKTVEAIKETIIEVAATPATADEPPPKEEQVEPEEVSIWGIPLLEDERSDTILLKFLRARDFKVKEAFTMIRNTIRWRKEFGVEDLLEQDLGNDYEKVLFTHGYDKQGRVVCYNVFGEFQDKQLYQNTFSDVEKRNKFLKWLIQFLEKIIRDLDFSPKGINSIVLVNDLKNFPGYGKRDVSKIIDKFLVILQDNYPEFVAKQLCINTSWWYVAYYWIYLTVFTPRSKSKFVFASPSKTPENLFKYIAPEHVPIQYGGHSKIGENEFSSADPVTEVIIKPGSKHPIEFAFSEATELVWELRVIGWDVNYGAEFVPQKEGGYTLNISKPKKVASSTDDPVITDSFKITEAGKVVITIDNQTSKKKKLLYRSKVKASE